MRFLISSILFIAALASAGTADAVCKWRVSSTLEGERAANALSAGRVWPLSGMEVRVQGRHIGGLWNTPNWPATVTGANGQFSVTSVIAFLDPDCQANREFRVQIRGFDTNYQWREVHRQTVAGPSGLQGPAIPAPVFERSIGDIICDDDGCVGGIIRIQGLTEPPVDLRPGNESGSDDGAGGDGDNGNRLPQAEEAPCGLRFSPFTQGVEFRFGQMPATPGPLSADQALRISTREAGAGFMTLNRIIFHIDVENAGFRDFVRNSRCEARVRFRLNEGPGRRGDDGWSIPYTARIPDIPANGSAAVSQSGNLWPAGDVEVGQWTSQWDGGENDPDFYEYALVEAVLDFTHAVPEAAEGDNRIVHCYHAPERVFVGMENCMSPSDDE